jgi:hypothetical protein
MRIYIRTYVYTCIHTYIGEAKSEGHHSRSVYDIHTYIHTYIRGDPWASSLMKEISAGRKFTKCLLREDVITN